MTGRVRRANIIVGAIVAAVLVAALAVVFGAGRIFGASGGHLRAIVHAGDGSVFELALDQDAEVNVVTSFGENKVVVKDDAVFVRDADCENLDCVRQGSIAAPGRQIICLPHRLWIEVVDDAGAGSSTGRMDVDAVAGGGDVPDTVSR